MLYLLDCSNRILHLDSAITNAAYLIMCIRRLFLPVSPYFLLTVYKWKNVVMYLVTLIHWTEWALVCSNGLTSFLLECLSVHHPLCAACATYSSRIHCVMMQNSPHQCFKMLLSDRPLEVFLRSGKLSKSCFFACSSVQKVCALSIYKIIQWCHKEHYHYQMESCIYYPQWDYVMTSFYSFCITDSWDLNCVFQRAVTRRVKDPYGVL